MPATIAATISAATEVSKPSSAVVADVASRMIAVRIRTLVLRVSAEYPSRPRTCPAPPRPSAVAAVPLPMPRSVSSGTRLITTANTANAARLNAITIVTNGTPRAIRRERCALGGR
jgi:hypothetical protein